ncbi:MAG: ATP synthase F1 subunit epsilon [Bryobacterales bacterium]|nr:ATP synthase F1 subunit epsilon [Bryobacterales bacterium]
MTHTFTLEVATPEKLLLHEHVLEAQIPAARGYIGILPGHSPLLGELGIGRLTYKKADGQTHELVVTGGYLEVGDGHVRVLASRAEAVNEIDLARAEAALRRAGERLLHPDDALDVARALNAQKRAAARVEAAKRQSGS